MASKKQTRAAKKNVCKALDAAKPRGFPGRSTMGRDELARARRGRRRGDGHP